MTKEIHDINTRALDFVVELIDYIAEYPDDDYMTMECLCRKLFKHGLIDKKDGYYLVADGINVDHKTEPQTSGIPYKIETSSVCKTEQTESPCDNCQEWDCYGCEYKQTERSE